MACTSCLCWGDIRRAVVAIGIFSMLTSLVQILVTVAAFTGYQSLQPNFGPILFTPISAPNSIAYILYITLSVFDFFVIIFALLLICGNERTDASRIRGYSMPWLFIIPFYIIFESGINIFYFSTQFRNGFANPLARGIYGFAIVPLVYWVIKELILIAGYVVVYKWVQPYVPCCHCVPYYKTHAPSLFTTQPVVAQCPYTATVPYQQTVVLPPPPPPTQIVESVYIPAPRMIQPPSIPKTCGCPVRNCGCNTSGLRSSGYNFGGMNVVNAGSSFVQFPGTTTFTPPPPAQPLGGYNTAFNNYQPTRFFSTIGRNLGFDRGFW